MLKRNYLSETLNECAGNTKKTWRVLKTLWPTKTKCQKIVKIDDETEPTVMANLLNDHFVTVGPKLSTNLPPGMAMHMQVNDPESSFLFEQISPEDVSKQLRGLSASKLCRVDGLMARLIKLCGDAIVPPPLTHIFNLILSHCIFPDI